MMAGLKKIPDLKDIRALRPAARPASTPALEPPMAAQPSFPPPCPAPIPQPRQSQPTIVATPLSISSALQPPSQHVRSEATDAATEVATAAPLPQVLPVPQPQSTARPVSKPEKRPSRFKSFIKNPVTWAVTCAAGFGAAMHFADGFQQIAQTMDSPLRHFQFYLLGAYTAIIGFGITVTHFFHMLKNRSLRREAADKEALKQITVSHQEAVEYVRQKLRDLRSTCPANADGQMNIIKTAMAGDECFIDYLDEIRKADEQRNLGRTKAGILADEESSTIDALLRDALFDVRVRTAISVRCPHILAERVGARLLSFITMDEAAKLNELERLRREDSFFMRRFSALIEKSEDGSYLLQAERNDVASAVVDAGKLNRPPIQIKEEDAKDLMVSVETLFLRNNV